MSDEEHPDDYEEDADSPDEPDEDDEDGEEGEWGECPFCGVRRYIPGADWQGECEHWVGVDDDFRGSEPVYLLTEGEPFDTFRRAVGALDRLGKQEREALIRSAPATVSRLLRDASEDEWGEGYWKNVVEHEDLEADIDEFLFSTTYRSYFVADPAAARETLGVLVRAALDHLKAKGLDPGPPGEE